jgi:hypothetical protein
MLKPGHYRSLPAGSKERLDSYSLPTPEIPPEEHVACLDMPYYFTEQPNRFGILEEWRQGLGVWSKIGRHLRFQPRILALQDRFLKRMFGLNQDAPIPPASFISRS